MTGDCHVRICEGLGVKFPWATRLFNLLIAANADEPKGFSHPMLIAMTSESLVRMEDTIFDPVLDTK